MIVAHEFIYRGNLQALGEFHSQFFSDCLTDGDIVGVYFRAEGVTSFTDNWYFGLKVNGADVLTGVDRPHITAGNLSPETTGLSIPVSFQDRFSPTVDARATGTINGPIVVIIEVDDGVVVGGGPGGGAGSYISFDDGDSTTTEGDFLFDCGTSA